MFETGFLGTRALWFMDLVTLWFALLPFLLGGAVAAAIFQRFSLHARLQTVLLGVTLVMVVIFEVGVRVSGGFLAYAEQSGIDFTVLTVLLAVHILIAVASVGAWTWLVADMMRRRLKQIDFPKRHAMYGRWTFVGMSVTSMMGVMIYILLFML